MSLSSSRQPTTNQLRHTSASGDRGPTERSACDPRNAAFVVDRVRARRDRVVNPMEPRLQACVTALTMPLPGKVRCSMRVTEIEVGGEYCYRTWPRSVETVVQVAVLARSRGKRIRVRFVAGTNRGLEATVESRQLVCRWKDRKGFLSEEALHRRLKEYSDEEWRGKDHPLTQAVGWVLDASGEYGWINNQGLFVQDAESVDRLVCRAGRSIPQDPLGYTDGLGRRHLSFQFAVRLAKSLAAVEPATVLSFLDDTERIWEAGAKEPGSSWMAEYRVERRPGVEIARQWARATRAADAVTEVERLRAIVEKLASELRSAGLDTLAAEAERDLSARPAVDAK